MSGVTNALRAASKGDIAALKDLKRRISLHSCGDKFGASLVHYAARAGKVDCVKWLVEVAGLNGTKPANNGATPAHDAAATGNLDTLRWLIETGGNPKNVRDSCGATPLHLAARFGHLNVVVWLVEEKHCSAFEKAQNGVTPVHLAAAKGSINCIKWLSQMFPRSADAPADNGTTPAYFAAQEGKLECLHFLVSVADADISLKANDGMSSIHAAAQMGHLDCFAWIVDNTRLSINEKDHDGATPMHFAAARGHVRIIEWVLAQGGAALCDDLGGTPLHDAAEHGQLDVIRVLVGGGVDPFIKDIDGLIPADLAEQCGHMECSSYLRSIPKQASQMAVSGSTTDTSESRGFISLSNAKLRPNVHLLEEVKQFAPQELKSVPEAEKKKKINVKVGQIVEREHPEDASSERDAPETQKPLSSGSVSRQIGQVKTSDELNNKVTIPAWKRALLEKRDANRSQYPPNSPLVPNKPKSEERRNSIPEWKKKLIFQKHQHQTS